MREIMDYMQKMINDIDHARSQFRRLHPDFLPPLISTIRQNPKNKEGEENDQDGF